MKKPLPNPFDWVANLLILLMLLYIGKSALGINWVKDCHAEEFLLEICQSPSK
jgi:hypothetical protein